LPFPELSLLRITTAYWRPFEVCNRLDRMPDDLPPVTYPRVPGRRPAPEENQHGAW
jgi:hypothetical protein